MSKFSKFTIKWPKVAEKVENGGRLGPIRQNFPPPPSPQRSAGSASAPWQCLKRTSAPDWGEAFSELKLIFVLSVLFLPFIVTNDFLLICTINLQQNKSTLFRNGGYKTPLYKIIQIWHMIWKCSVLFSVRHARVPLWTTACHRKLTAVCRQMSPPPRPAPQPRQQRRQTPPAR